MKKRLIYLACPFSHKDKAIRKLRKLTADRVAAALMLKGFVVFSPLSHSYPIIKQMTNDVEQDYGFWMDQDLPILERCDEMHVIGIKGWDISKGLIKEMDFFRNLMYTTAWNNKKFVFYDQAGIDNLLNGINPSPWDYAEETNGGVNV